MKGHAVLITCEHGGNRIPAAYRRLFSRRNALLASHRGYDPGALHLARDLAKACNAPLIGARVSRLVVELNRSVRHRNVFSAITRGLSNSERQTLLARHYFPYRNAVERWVGSALRARQAVVHISAHTFTPVLGGQVREADAGLLYDPQAAGEARFCALWRARIRMEAPDFKVRRNYPYRGRSDGLTTHLRRIMPPGRYVGVELEVNQKHALGATRSWRRVRKVLACTLKDTLTLWH